MISVIYEKEDKKTAIQISKSLESKGFKCNLTSITSISNTQKEKLADLELAVLIFSQKSNISEKIINEYEIIFENEIELIPFVISDVELSISMHHFLNSHDWINAYDVNTNEAIKDLNILVNEILNNDNSSLQKTKNNTKSAEQKQIDKKKLQTYLTIGVGAIFAIIILFFIFRDDSGSIINTPTSDNPIVGTWYLADYKDNLPRQPKDYAEFLKSVSALKQRFKLTINEDKTFEKLGFEKPEYGNWLFDKQNNLLYMWPQGSNGKNKDLLQIEKITNDSLIMSIASKIDSTTQIITRFSLYKQQQQ